MINSIELSATQQVSVRMPKARPGWMTFQDAAARLGVSRSTLWRWWDGDRDGLKARVRSLKMGREHYLNEADLDAWDAARWGEAPGKAQKATQDAPGDAPDAESEV